MVFNSNDLLLFVLRNREEKPKFGILCINRPCTHPFWVELEGKRGKKNDLFNIIKHDN